MGVCVCVLGGHRFNKMSVGQVYVVQGCEEMGVGQMCIRDRGRTRVWRHGCGAGVGRTRVWRHGCGAGVGRTRV